jgi:membrane protein DedA with SNARE-associated domain
MLIASLLSWPVNEILKVPGGVVYPLVFFLVFGEAALFIGFVLPGETSVLVAGVVASQGRVNIVLLCALVVVAAVTGDSVGYFVGERYGEKLLTISMIKKRRIANGAERRTFSLDVLPRSCEQ